MNSLRIEWEMYAMPVLSFCALVLLLIVANFFAERAFKSRPGLRRRTYACLKALGVAYLATVVLAIFIGALHASWCFPFFLLIALVLFGVLKKSGTAV
jgi:MFS-type transporter involved in bile tolerance (Atg22 family)